MQQHAPPFILEEFKIEVTYQCDLNCIHCSSDATPSNTLELPREDCLRILHEAREMGAKEVAFSGGEPLGWTHIFDVVKVAVKNRLRTTIYTSGNTNNFKKKAESLHQLGISRLIFSIFGSTQSTHERITRRAGSFERTRKAMLDAHAIGLSTELHFVPMSTNYRELKDIVLLLPQLGISVISVLRLVPQGRAALLRARTLSNIQNLELRHQIQELRRSGFNIRTGSPYNFLMLNDKPGCAAAIDRLIVGPDMNVYPCDAFKRILSEDIVGTAKWSSIRDSSLSDCWVKSPYLEMVRTYLTTDFPVLCDSCEYLSKCLSGCLAQKVISYGNIEKRPDPDCLRKKL